MFHLVILVLNGLKSWNDTKKSSRIFSGWLWRAAIVHSTFSAAFCCLLLSSDADEKRTLGLTGPHCSDDGICLFSTALLPHRNGTAFNRVYNDLVPWKPHFLIPYLPHMFRCQVGSSSSQHCLTIGRITITTQFVLFQHVGLCYIWTVLYD